jgi:secreted trypsin-like serine protease
MAAWFVPAVKAILPYVSSIVAAAVPVFTTRKIDEAAAAQAQVIQKQIAELQSAASQNAAHIKALAGQLQKTVAALEQGASVPESRYWRIAALCIGAVLVSGIALCVSLIALFGR